MSTKALEASGKATKGIRMGIAALTLLLTFLWIWLLGFLLKDLGNLRGPDFEAVRSRHVKSERANELAGLNEQVREIGNSVRQQQQIQQNLKTGMDNARETMTQMMSLHRLGIEKGTPPTDTQQQALATSQQRFLELQERFEQANTEIAKSNDRKFRLDSRMESLTKEIDQELAPANAEYQRLQQRHRFLVASLQLGLVVPIFLFAGFMIHRKRNNPFLPVFVSILAASFWKVGRVMFDHFPREFFKYVAIGSAILFVLSFLIWMLKRAAKPNLDIVMKRVREGYKKRVCPVCEFPQVRDPSRLAALDPSVGRSSSQGAGNGAAASDNPYTCPSCGTALFEKCGSCGRTRHSLLPFCEHCRAEKPVGTLET